MICSKCKNQIDDDSKFCIFCGRDIDKEIHNIEREININCFRCGRLLDIDSKFCPECGEEQVDNLEYTDGNLEAFEKNRKWGLKDKNTRDIIIPPKYTKIGNFVEKRAIVVVNNKFAVIDENGNELTRFKYDYISDFKKGFAKIKRDNKWSFLDIDCNLISAFKYIEVENFHEGIARVRLESNNQILINTNGEKLTDEHYKEIVNFNNNLYKVSSDNFFGLINNKGETILKCNYDDIVKYKFSEDEKTEFIKFSKNNKKGLINLNGEKILPCKFDSFKKITDNLIKVVIKDQFGLYSSNGKEITPCIYDIINEINNGIAKVSKNGKYGFINTQGTVIIPASYKLTKVLANDVFAVKKNGKWKCFNNKGEDVTTSDFTFKKFIKHKKINKKIIIIGFCLFISTGIFDFYSNEIGLFRNWYIPHYYSFNIKRFIKSNNIKTYTFTNFLPVLSNSKNSQDSINVKDLNSFIKNVKLKPTFHADSIQIDLTKRIVARKKSNAVSSIIIINEKYNKEIKLLEAFNRGINKIEFGILSKDELILKLYQRTTLFPKFYKVNLSTNEYVDLEFQGSKFNIIKSGNYKNHIFIMYGDEKIESNYVLYDRNGKKIKDFGIFKPFLYDFY